MNLKNKNDKLFLIMVFFIIAVIVFLIVSLFFIWRGKDDDGGLTSYSYSGFEDKVVTMYQKQVQILLKQSNVKLLAEKLDDEFLSNNNLSRDNLDKLRNYLNSKGLLSKNRASITNYTTSINNETGVVVYRFKYYNLNGYTRYINLIETQPYVYTLSFDEVSTLTSAKRNIIDSSNKIKFELNLRESTTNYLKYNLKITNENDEIVKFDFNNVSSVELLLSNGKTEKLSSVIASSEEDFELTKNSYLNQELFFNINLEEQGNIKSIIFYNVLIGEQNKNIKIDF